MKKDESVLKRMCIILIVMLLLAICKYTLSGDLSFLKEGAKNFLISATKDSKKDEVKEVLSKGDDSESDTEGDLGLPIRVTEFEDMGYDIVYAGTGYSEDYTVLPYEEVDYDFMLEKDGTILRSRVRLMNLTENPEELKDCSVYSICIFGNDFTVGDLGVGMVKKDIESVLGDPLSTDGNTCRYEYSNGGFILVEYLKDTSISIAYTIES